MERHAEKDSYAGICDDIKVGISLIFYLRNRIPYIKAQSTGKLPIRGTTLTLSGLSLTGSILLPIKKDEEQVLRDKKDSANRNKLLAAAQTQGRRRCYWDPDAGRYGYVHHHFPQDPEGWYFQSGGYLFYALRRGVRQYSVLGEITELRLATNDVTGEKVYILTILCNELSFDVCINEKDIYGEPQVGRRFKGVIWLQGYINFPEE